MVWHADRLWLDGASPQPQQESDINRWTVAALKAELFGLVGNFNYAPIRLVTWMPAGLMEQAFVTHPGNEARLLDPAFRVLMAKAVRLGLDDFLRQP